MPNQDNDIIQAAEEAQQVDLVEAEHELVLTDSEQKAALTALAKVSSVIVNWSTRILIVPWQLTKLTYKINNSPGLVIELEALCRAANIKPLHMIKPVDT